MDRNSAKELIEENYNNSANGWQWAYKSDIEKMIDKIYDDFKKEKHGCVFTFENGDKQFIPFLESMRGITHKGQRPISYDLTFTKEELNEWVEFEITHALKKDAFKFTGSKKPEPMSKELRDRALKCLGEEE